MTGNTLLLSVKPQYANKIFEGTKTVELRRVRPKYLQQGDLVLIYVSSPVKALSGAFKVDKIVEKPLKELWRSVRKGAGISRQEFNEYYQGTSTGIGLFFKVENVWHFPEPIGLKALQEDNYNYHPPQGFRYATKDEQALALKLTGLVQWAI